MKYVITSVKRTLFFKTLRLLESFGQPVMQRNKFLFNAKTAASRSHRYIYYRIPKAANTSVVHSLYAFECALPEDASSDLRFIKDDYFSNLSQFNEDELLDIQESWFKFTVVRNPYSRILSVYRDKISGTGSKREYVNRFLGRPLNDTVSFDQFLYYLEHGGIALNPHWVPQATLIPGGIQNLDYWGKLESIETAFLHISTRIYGRPAPLRFASHNPTGSSLSDPLLTQVNKQRLTKLYHSDFEAFSYPM